MQELTVSLRNNNIRISTVEKGEFKGVSAEVSTSVVKEFEILDSAEFTRIMDDLIASLTQKSKKSLLLNFLIEPQECFFNFVTVNKNNGEVEDQVVAEIKSKLKTADLEDLYFAYYKIAPFVYQFLAIKKDVMDKYLELSNALGIGLKSMLPWVLLLPKFVSTNEPAIFISKAGDKQIVALSEFNGLFFSDVYKADKPTSELQKLVQELSIYKRKEPISKVYVFDHEGFTLNPDYEVLSIEIPNQDADGAKGYELHLLVNDLIQKEPDLLFGPVNMLSMLPVPVVVEKKNMSLVAVGSTVGALLLIALVVGGISFFGNKNDNAEVIQNTPQNNQVLSENTAPEQPAAEEQPVTQELKKEDLSIRIENGAGLPGVAGRTQEFLEGKGYTVQSIGNSDEVGRTTTLVKLNPSKASYQEIIIADLGDDFDPVIETDLEDGLEYDVLIVVGTDAGI